MPVQPSLAVIVAASQNGVIGRNNQLPWRLSGDLQRFKTLTMGSPIIMGRKTFQSLGRFLPGRQHWVVSRQTDPSAWWPAATPDSVGQVVDSFSTALERATGDGSPRVFAIGGASIFQEALDIAGQLHFTRVLADVPGDAWLPAIDWGHWNLVSRHEHFADHRNDYDFVFEDYQRVT